MVLTFLRRTQNELVSILKLKKKKDMHRPPKNKSNMVS